MGIAPNSRIRNDSKTVERPGGLFCVDNCCFITHVLRFEKQKHAEVQYTSASKDALENQPLSGESCQGSFIPAGNQLFKDLLPYKGSV
jgi:hypothetical protein